MGGIGDGDSEYTYFQIWKQRTHLLTLHCLLTILFLLCPGIIWSHGLGCPCDRFQQDHEIYQKTRGALVTARTGARMVLAGPILWHLGLRNRNQESFRLHSLAKGKVMWYEHHWSRTSCQALPPSCHSSLSLSPVYLDLPGIWWGFWEIMNTTL